MDPSNYKPIPLVALFSFLPDKILKGLDDKLLT